MNDQTIAEMADFLDGVLARATNREGTQEGLTDAVKDLVIRYAAASLRSVEVAIRSEGEEPIILSAIVGGGEA